MPAVDVPMLRADAKEGGLACNTEKAALTDCGELVDTAERMSFFAAFVSAGVLELRIRCISAGVRYFTLSGVRP